MLLKGLPVTSQKRRARQPRGNPRKIQEKSWKLCCHRNSVSATNLGGLRKGKKGRNLWKRISPSVIVTGIRVREKPSVGKTKYEPISGTLERNWRSSKVSEPTGEVSWKSRFKDSKGRLSRSCGQSNWGLQRSEIDNIRKPTRTSWHWNSQGWFSSFQEDLNLRLIPPFTEGTFVQPHKAQDLSRKSWDSL